MDSKKTVRIIKVGGHNVDDPEFLAGLAAIVGRLGHGCVLIHGGGDSISELERTVFLREPVFVAGKRKTDSKTLQLAEMVLCGAVNKKIVRSLSKVTGILPIGISGEDAHLICAEADPTLGLVAKNIKVNAKPIRDLCRLGYTPVIAPLVLDYDGRPLNANADDVACALAKSLSARELIFITNVAGVFVGHECLEFLTESDAERLISEGLVSGGMIVKVKSAIEAAKKTGARVRICNLESFAGGKGTLVACESEQLPARPNSKPFLPFSSTKLAPLFAKNGLDVSTAQGMRLWTQDGNCYLDFSSGIAVNALGHKHPAIVGAIIGQAEKPLHLSNLFQIPEQELLAEKLVSGCFAERVFFCNSGTEANEAALKFAFKYHFSKGDKHRTRVLAFNGGFHGRTLGALSVTEKQSYRMPFLPYLFETEFYEFNDVEALKRTFSCNVAAVIVEPIQGESGIHPATKEFLTTLRELCDENGTVLIFDEVQCGLMRTGELWAHQGYGVFPDIMTAAKPLGGGLPLGATFVSSQISSALAVGDHGSTFGGNPMACALGDVVLSEVQSIQAQILSVGRELGEVLYDLRQRFPHLISDIRGRGLMWGLDVQVPVAAVIQSALKNGLFMIAAGVNTIRLLPPLICTIDEVSEFKTKFAAALDDVGASARSSIQLRAACLEDSVAIHKLIELHAENRRLLPRSFESISSCVDQFTVAEWNGVVVGCISYRDWSDGYREVRSLAVIDGAQGHGIGRQLLSQLILQSTGEGVRELFAMTLCKEFFKSANFTVKGRSSYPFKEEGDCKGCEYFAGCNEVAVGLELNSIANADLAENCVNENL